MDVNSLRKKYPEITYRHFNWKIGQQALHLNFEYYIRPRFTFHTKVDIHFKGSVMRTDIPEAFINNAVFHLGLVDLFSYWKLVCAPVIAITAGSLTWRQITFWQRLLIRGMGEYFYKNRVDFTRPNFVTWQVAPKPAYLSTFMPNSNKYLLLIGGGKDSLIAQQILTELKGDVATLKETTYININNLPAKTVAFNVTVDRTLDPQLIRLNQAGYLNGHVPYSAYLAFVSVIAAAFTGSKYIVVGNERSADEANVIYLKKRINHQYSKTFEFETEFRNYLTKYITPYISYFSLIRPLYELEIARLISRYPELVDRFSSCNRLRENGKWCGKCPKCLSTFLLFAPFIGVAEITRIIGKNLLIESTLLPLFKNLIDPSLTKPFECVATYRELQVASYLLTQAFRERNEALPVLLGYFAQDLLPQRANWDKPVQAILTHWDSKHFIPPEIAQYLKSKITQL